MNIWWALGFVEGVTPLVCFPHPVNNQHHLRTHRFAQIQEPDWTEDVPWYVCIIVNLNFSSFEGWTVAQCLWWWFETDQENCAEQSNHCPTHNRWTKDQSHTHFYQRWHEVTLFGGDMLWAGWLQSIITCKNAWLCKEVCLPTLRLLVRLLGRCRRPLPWVRTAWSGLLHCRGWAPCWLVVEPNVNLIWVDLLVGVLERGFWSKNFLEIVSIQLLPHL